MSLYVYENVSIMLPPCSHELLECYRNQMNSINISNKANMSFRMYYTSSAQSLKKSHIVIHHSCGKKSFSISLRSQTLTALHLLCATFTYQDSMHICAKGIPIVMTIPLTQFCVTPITNMQTLGLGLLLNQSQHWYC